MSDPVSVRVEEMVRRELARAEEALGRAREELAACERTRERLSGRVVRLEAEVAGWAARVDG